MNFNKLNKRLQKLLASEPVVPTNTNYAGCLGDGNLDLVVNDLDLQNGEKFACADGSSQACSSWYDFNFHGTTDQADRHIIEENLGSDCRKRR